MSGAKNKRVEKARRKRLVALTRARAMLAAARRKAILDPSHVNLARVHALEAALVMLEGLHRDEAEAADAG